MSDELDQLLRSLHLRSIAENLDEELLRDLMASAFLGDEGEMPEEFFQAFLDVAAECDLPLE